MHVECFMVRRSWGFFSIYFVVHILCTSVHLYFLSHPHASTHLLLHQICVYVCVTQMKITAFLICSVYIFSLNLCKVNFEKGPLKIMRIWVEKSSVGLDTEFVA